MKKQILFILLIVNCQLSIVFGQEPVLIVNSGHSGMVHSVCFSPDGKYALSGSSDKTMKLWDVSQGKEIKTYTFENDVCSVFFSEDGKIIFSRSKAKQFLEGREIKSYDLYTGKEKADYEKGFYLSPQGKYLVAKQQDKTCKIMDIGAGTWINSFPVELDKVCISPDGKYMLAAPFAKTNLELWEISSGKQVVSFYDHPNFLWALCFSPDGKYAVSAGWDKIINLYEIPSGKLLRKFSGHTKTIRDVCFTTDSKYIFSGGEDNCIKMWEISSGNEVKKFVGHTSFINCISVSPDGKFILSGGVDQSIRLWEISSGKEIRTFSGHSSNAWNVGISPDGKYAVSGNFKTIKLWDISSGKLINSMQGHSESISSVCFSKDNKFILSGSGDKTLKLWEVPSGTLVRTYSGHPGRVSTVCLSQDRKYALSGDDEHIMKLWDISSGNELKSFKDNDWVYTVCFSPDNKYALSGNLGNEIKIWDLASGNELKVFKNSSWHSPVNSVCFSQDGKFILSGDADFLVKLWDVATGNIVKSFKGHTDRVNSVCFSPNGKYALSGCYDKTIKLWDIASGKLIKTFIGHADQVTSVCFSPDGKFILSSGWDKKLKFWSIATGKELCSLIYVDENDWLVITPDGRFDGTEGGMKQLYYVKDLDIIPLESLFEQYYTPRLFTRILSGEQFSALQVNVSSLKPKPLVKITSPENNSVQKTDQLTVTIDATDQGGGIDEILLYHNGKLVQTTNRGFKPVEKNGEKLTKTFTITLSDGENSIKATAFNSQRTEAIPEEITVNFKGAQVAKPDLYLFVIGINKYKNSKYNLNYAVADALGFKQAIEQGSSSIFNSIKTTYLTNTEALRPRILEEIDKIKSQVKQEDVFIFYYAGHGVMSEEQIPQFYIIPHDVTQLYGNEQLLQTKGISASELKQFSTEIKAQKQLYILDACQSGGMTGMLASRGAAEEKAINQLARSTGTYWLAASNSEQFAGEFDKIGHGLFTYCILEGLSGKADGQNDKKVTVQELSTFLNDQVPIISKQYKGLEQYPNTYGYGHDFPILIVK